MAIKAHSAGSVEERLAKLEQSVNRSLVVLPFSAVTQLITVSFGAPQYFGGCIVDRAWLRTRLPDARWVVRAAGWINPADANGALVELVYTTGPALGTTDYSLGSITPTGAGGIKTGLGPFDVFGTAGVPQTETYPSIRLKVTKLVSGSTNVNAWDLWLELRSSTL